MRLFSTINLATLLASTTLLAMVSTADAQCHKGYGYRPGYCAPVYYDVAPRQFYQDWAFSKQINGYFCHYYYKPYAGYPGYVKHVCIAYPGSYPGKVFYFDPGTKLYYGCYDVKAKKFLIVDAKDRQPTVAATPEKALVTPAAPPKLGELPGATPPAGAVPFGPNEPRIEPPLPAPEAPIAPPTPNGSEPPTGTPPPVEPMTEPVAPTTITGPGASDAPANPEKLSDDFAALKPPPQGEAPIAK